MAGNSNSSPIAYLSAEAPYAVHAIGAEGLPVEPLCLEHVAIDTVDLPPASCSTSVDGLVFSRTRQAWVSRD